MIFVFSCITYLVLLWSYQTRFISQDEGRLILYFFYVLIFCTTFFSGFAPGIVFALLSSIYAVNILMPGALSLDNFTVTDLEIFPFIAVYFLIAITVDWFRENIEALRKKLVENEELHAHTRRMEKLALAGEIAAGITHEIRNPLTVIQGYVQLLEQNCESSEQDVYQLVLDEIKRTNQIISDFLRFSRPDTPKKSLVQLNDVIDSAVSLVYGEAVRKNIEIYFYPAHGLPQLCLDRDQFIQVFLNLFTNALQAMPNGGTLSVSAIWKEKRKTAVVRVNDSGQGISPEALGKVFTPFFTTKDAGTGLGLSISQNIILAHHGIIEVESIVGQGTQFTICIPVDDTCQVAGQIC
jgi:signal transduction histidine kinase